MVISDTGGLVMLPWAFRCAVARMWRLERAEAWRFLDVAPDSEPAIHVGLPAGDAVLPGHIFRVGASGTHDLYLFTTGLGVKACDQAIAAAMTTRKEVDPVFEPSGPESLTARRVGFHADPVTEFTVVHVLSPQWNCDAAGPLMSRLLEICVAAEMVAEIEATPPSSARYRNRGCRDTP